MHDIVPGLVQAIAFIVLSPLVQGIVKKVKAVLQARQGPPVLQPYRDLRKYFDKDTIIPHHSSWIFRITPYAVFSLICTVALMVPAFTLHVAFSSSSDLVVIVFLFGMARVLTVLSGLDTGNAFGGLGATRDMFISVLAEPVLFVTLLAVAIPAKSTQLTELVAHADTGVGGLTSPSWYMVLVSLVVIVITETGRLPVDNPDTHLELTMIHEGMLLEYSGPLLALMMWGQWMKQMLLYALLIDLCLPWGIMLGSANWSLTVLSIIVFALKILAIAVAMAFIETAYAKVRLFRIPRLLAVAFVLSLMAIAAEFVL